MNRKRSLKIDVHVHLAGTGCDGSGCWAAPGFERRPTFRLLRRLYGISERQMRCSVDGDWVRMIAERVAGSELDYAVVLGFDAVADPNTGSVDVGRSQLFVPDQWVFETCRSTPGLLPGPSINPYLIKSLDRLQRAIEQGAVLIKWLPATQEIDPGDERLVDFYRLMARSGLPLLVHMGGERTFKSIAPQLNDVTRLRLPLDHGVKVICAHSATAIHYSREPDQLGTLKRLLAEYPHLWVDNSGMCNPSRHRHLPRLARDELIESRTLYGSDWPVPSNAMYYVFQLGPARALKLERTKNDLQRDISIKRSLGYSDQSLSRADEVLAHLDRWIPSD